MTFPRYLRFLVITAELKIVYTIAMMVFGLFDSDVSGTTAQQAKYNKYKEVRCRCKASYHHPFNK